MNADNGGPAFPVAFVQGSDPHGADAASGNEGMTLLDWFAGQETLSDFDHPDVSFGDKLAFSFAGPKPPGGWAEDQRVMFDWESRVRAGMKYSRAQAMLAEKRRREGGAS